ncbi:MAG TPA: thymidylate synthase [Methanosarcinaceae archaeon]|nr:thymidylate synthase [Methanosarcinaceae archaeon]
MRISVFYTGEFGRKVIENLVNSSTFCISCADLCDHCREKREPYGNMIVDIHELPDDLPRFVEEPMEYVPQGMGECDLILAMGIHPDLLTTLPYIAKTTGASAVIVPVEDHKLVPAGVIGEIREKLEEEGIECEFPKPFCSLGKTGKQVIDDFVGMGFGKPVLRIELNPGGDIFTQAEVLRDAPCGSTWFVAKKLKWSDVDDYKETISGAHHSYPCTASMERDPLLEDTILHEGGYIIRKSVEEGMGDP